MGFHLIVAFLGRVGGGFRMGGTRVMPVPYK